MAEYEKYEYFIKELEEYYLQDKRRSVITRSLLKQATEYIKELLADVAPVRHGRWGRRWICSNMTGYEYACSCSECGKPTYRISTIEPMPPYCPNCGAKMDGET